MIPQRFNVEYPQRCLALLDAMEREARDRDLLASFALLTAASVLVIPFERLKKGHPLEQDKGTHLAAAIRDLKKQKWSDAAFWREPGPGNWRLSLVTSDPNHVAGWTDAKGQRSFSPEASDIGRRKADEVIRVLRNALAHGNVVYLNEAGYEEAGSPVRYLAFLSRREETQEEREKAETYRLVVVSDEDFLAFLRQWAQWLADFPPEGEIVEPIEAF